MIDNSVKTYAWRNAINSSKTLTRNTTPAGKIANTDKLDRKMLHVNPARIFKRLCPAIILANNRIERLKTLAINEISSITTRKGAITKGTPEGKKIPSPFALCSKQIKMISAKNCWNAKKKVRINELVMAAVYGIIPKRLLENIKKNK